MTKKRNLHKPRTAYIHPTLILNALALIILIGAPFYPNKITGRLNIIPSNLGANESDTISGESDTAFAPLKLFYTAPRKFQTGQIVQISISGLPMTEEFDRFQIVAYLPDDTNLLSGETGLVGVTKEKQSATFEIACRQTGLQNISLIGVIAVAGEKQTISLDIPLQVESPPGPATLGDELD